MATSPRCSPAAAAGHTTLAWILIGLTAAVLYACWPLWPSLLLAAWTARLVRVWLPPFERVCRGRRAAAASLTALVFLGFVLPFSLVIGGAFSGAKELLALFEQSTSAKGALESLASASESTSLSLPQTLPEVVDGLQRYGAKGLSLIATLAGAAASGLVAMFMYLGGTFVLLVDGEEAWAWCKRHSPIDPEHLERFSGAFHETGRGLLVGVGLTTLTQGVVATLAYLALGVPRWWILGPITGLASMIPFVGSALVWGPISLGLALTDHGIKAAILAVVGVGVISTADNALRPIFARLGHLRLPTFLLYVALFGGLAVFGAWGALLAPLLVRLWLEAIVLRREVNEAAHSPGEA